MQLEISLIISQILAFLVMLWVMKKFAWKPLLRIMKERKEKIQSEFSFIEKEKAEIQHLNTLYQQKLSEIDILAKQKIDLATEEGQKKALIIQQEAHESAKEILQKAQQDIEMEVRKAQEELKNKLVDTIVDVSEKFIQEKIDSDKDKAIIKELIDGVH